MKSLVVCCFTHTLWSVVFLFMCLVVRWYPLCTVACSMLIHSLCACWSVVSFSVCLVAWCFRSALCFYFFCLPHSHPLGLLFSYCTYALQYLLGLKEAAWQELTHCCKSIWESMFPMNFFHQWSGIYHVIEGKDIKHYIDGNFVGSELFPLMDGSFSFIVAVQLKISMEI